MKSKKEEKFITRQKEGCPIKHFPSLRRFHVLNGGKKNQTNEEKPEDGGVKRKNLCNLKL